MANHQINHILISRTDSIGDVVLTLPVAKILKDNFPGVKISFMGKLYTKPVIETCKYVDEFVDVNDFMNKPFSADVILHIFPIAKIAKRAKQLKTPMRIGTRNRIYHWFTCNRLVKLSRRKSDLHEAQLNLKLLKGLEIDHDFSLEKISNSFGLEKLKPLQKEFSDLIKKDKYNLILHPKSQGSAREWGLDNFIELINSLDTNYYQIFISGTKKERELLQRMFDTVAEKITDITGLMSLEQFISFIAKCDGLVANSTGPLHIAGALGKDALGIYSPRKSINPQRWKPLGANAKYFVFDKICFDCKGKNDFCHCITEVKPGWIKNELGKKLKYKKF